MSTAAIEVKNLWKKFRIYYDRALTLKERLLFWGRQKYEDFWALKDINLTKLREGCPRTAF
ncbi:hypothetical protein Adeg_0507 [Ammonifex degensii KC4]|uniref:Uncharacterized protein n=1 Tax=Ammonifex degensii (strain DSM 10501 / KC4) TaxID=429009 RepID=C9RBN0_AMMDK|nr:hypothetical protein [Ammonifex degensii]ACX51657.1 hypothetical protein Adeg_0507 [Ammonifex degensii KC4]